MDKSWMSSNRQSIAYEKGVASFIKYAIKNSDNPNFIRCPCEKCVNMIYRTPREVVDHLFVNGIDGSYKDWSWHGEKTTFSCEDHYNDQNTNNDFAATVEMVHDAFRYCDNDVESLRDLLEDAEKPLYPGCSKYTKLSGLLKLYNVKGRYGWSDKSFSELLICLQDIFPEDNLLPLSIYEAKKTMSVLGVQYEKIHACPNDCILYRKNYENLVECPSCGQSRWKNQSKHIDKKKLKVPAKVLWYFPIVPRLRRLFQSPETAKDLTWHAHGRENDGMLRHPADSPSWKLVDKLWPDFASEIRNVRFALCSDGINPFGTLSSQYSCWPVILVNYNLPPWLCMKRKFLMLSLLISGPRQPGNDIDVYLAPLIDDLKILWDVGIEAYDASKQESFILRAMLMWTISDFPAYGNLSGCVTKGYYACPICKEGTAAQWLSHSNKMVYMGHRRFLPRGHSFRDKTRVFNNKVETEFPPKPLTGEQILKMVDGINCTYGKNKKKMKRKKGVSSVKGDVKVCYKKKSIFFELVYWKHLLVRHQLDVMHIEKNVCESIYGTLLNIPGKTKDGLKARLDLVELKIRPELTPKNEGSSTVLPPACFTLSREEKMKFCQTLVDIKVAEGYCSNLKNLVSMSDLKLHGLKSHDCHVLMQQILPLAIRSILPEHVRCAIIRLCFFFNSLCTNVVDPNKLDQLQLDIVETLCVLEKTFMPCFFDIMIHLTVHLVEEVRLCGPVCLRWMYPFEREMKPLKGYVRNRNRPEGCIAQCYMVEEAMEFCADFLSVLNAIGNPPGQKDMILIEKPLTSGVMVEVRHELLEQAHRYVLQNTAEVQPYIEMCESENNAYGGENNDSDPLDLNGRPSRGITKKASVFKRQSNSGQIVVEYNERGIPCGAEAIDMDQTIGMLARQVIPIVYNDWRKVPQIYKEELWKYIQKLFKVDVCSKKQVIMQMGTAHRQFRHNLYVTYIVPNKHNRRELQKPPLNYQYIKDHHWKEFVDQKLSHNFEEQRRRAQDARKQNQYNHSLGSGGYKRVVKKIMKETGLSELQIDRSILWKEGRKSKSGEFKSEALPIVNKIDNLAREVKKGVMKVEGRDDILAKALGKPPVTGHMQGLGKFITASMYFDTVKTNCSINAEGNIFQETLCEINSQLKHISAHLNVSGKDSEGVSSNMKISGKKVGQQLDIDAVSSDNDDGDETIIRMKISEDIEHILSQAEEHSRILKMKRCEEIERFLTMAQELLRFQGKKVYFEDLIYGQCDINTYITIEDCSVLAYFEELTVNCLMIWTMKLYEELKKIGMTMKYKFINPAAVSLSGRANTNKSRIDRTKIIVSQLEGIQSGQLCFMPYNPKFHWVLIVIDMDSNTIYYLDPMRQPMHMDLRLLLNNAMARLNVKESASSNKVKVNWATVKAPRQPGNVECGFYVMSYMQDIIADNSVLKEDFFGKKTYNEEEIDEIRKEWASFVLEKL
ncbi:uncharacterized protein LOC102623946 isoform X2 [Citrus sinensis]|uniref:uncharacterized protein LOC18038159 isoform X2 n=1 Tax=Citrus clementina TaxID=85681 RepID=UPI000CED7AC4|nr:uncharacterized protein LOC18038159 isoform X2 [Citrus x clementina]XP_052299614.1 uncharacterized protein LOC102623946 isoform X2 [Citrus sinensis]